jgi:hypothetical protein
VTNAVDRSTIVGNSLRNSHRLCSADRKILFIEPDARAPSSQYPASYTQSKFEVSWRWRLIICKTVLVDFVHRLNYEIIKLRFQSWILLPSSDKEGRKKTESLSVAPPG